MIVASFWKTRFQGLKSLLADHADFLLCLLQARLRLLIGHLAARHLLRSPVCFLLYVSYKQSQTSSHAVGITAAQAPLTSKQDYMSGYATQRCCLRSLN